MLSLIAVLFTIITVDIFILDILVSVSLSPLIYPCYLFLSLFLIYIGYPCHF